MAEFKDWQEPEEVAGMATLVAVGRDGVDPGDVVPVLPESGMRLKVRFLTVARVDISSNEIRAMAGDGQSIRYLVPEAVKEIIETQSLYRSNS